jgi:hypothetical protein
MWCSIQSLNKFDSQLQVLAERLGNEFGAKFGPISMFSSIILIFLHLINGCTN